MRLLPTIESQRGPHGSPGDEKDQKHQRGGCRPRECGTAQAESRTPYKPSNISSGDDLRPTPSLLRESATTKWLCCRCRRRLRSLGGEDYHLIKASSAAANSSMLIPSIYDPTKYSRSSSGDHSKKNTSYKSSKC